VCCTAIAGRLCGLNVVLAGPGIYDRDAEGGSQVDGVSLNSFESASRESSTLWFFLDWNGWGGNWSEYLGSTTLYESNA